MDIYFSEIGSAYFGDYNELVYLRARHYTPSTGRFLTKDPSRQETNLYLYTNANPINKFDPTGLFAKDILERNNLSLMDFAASPADAVHHSHWGFYLLLRNANDGDSIDIGYVDLHRQYPDVAWKGRKTIQLINCEQILVDWQPLKHYYEQAVRQSSQPTIWWRDTTVSYYKLIRGNSLPIVGSDGLDFNKTDFPILRSLDASIGLGAIEVSTMVDIDGNEYVATSGGPGFIAGIGYTESYICGWGSPCSTVFSSEIEEAVIGFCLGGEAVLLAGINISPICHGPNLSSEWSKMSTYYWGVEGGIGIGVSLTFPAGITEPARGWRWALIDQQNGITYDKIVAWEGQRHP